MRRHRAGLIRYLMAGMRKGEFNTAMVAELLELSVRRVEQLYAQYLESCAGGKEAEWQPCTSGGYQGRAIPAEVDALWRKMLKVKPPAPYAFAASEALRRCEFCVDRATVRVGH
jgi:hypothetical protein